MCSPIGHNNTKHFLCPIRSRHPLEFLEMVRWESVPRGSFARNENFRPASSPDPTGPTAPGSPQPRSQGSLLPALSRLLRGAGRREPWERGLGLRGCTRTECSNSSLSLALNSACHESDPYWNARKSVFHSRGSNGLKRSQFCLLNKVELNTALLITTIARFDLTPLKFE